MAKYILADGTESDAPDPKETKVVWAMGIALLVSTIFFTIIHHGFPQVFNAPGNFYEKKLPDGVWLIHQNDPAFALLSSNNIDLFEAARGSSIIYKTHGEISDSPIPEGSYFIMEPDWIDQLKLKDEGVNNPRVLPIRNGSLKVPIPASSLPIMFLLDLIPIALAWLCFHHAWRRLGIYRAMIFLGGSFVFTGLEESMWILIGRFQADLQAMSSTQALQDATLGAHAAEVTGTYYFTKGFFWFIETPLLACLGWFFVAYACVYVADVLIPKANIWARATLGGLLAMNLDLWLDPVQTHNAFLSWIWGKGDPIEIFSIPLSNFMGWFLLIFLFAIVFDKLPAMVSRWGPAKAAVYFYSILFALEIGILTFFVVYGSVAGRLIPDPINFTIWDIGVHSLKL